MSEPEITVRKVSAYIVASEEAIEASPAAGLLMALTRALEQATDPTYVPPKPWEGEPITPAPSGYGRIQEAVRPTPLLAELVELHGPKPDHVYPDGSVYRWRCEGCDADGYDWEHPAWPCRTSELIAERLGVDLGEVR